MLTAETLIMALLASSIFLSMVSIARLFHYLNEIKENSIVIKALDVIKRLQSQKGDTLPGSQRTLDTDEAKQHRFNEIDKIFSGMRLIVFEAKASLFVITIFGIVAVPSLAFPEYSIIIIDWSLFIGLVLVIGGFDLILMTAGVGALLSRILELKDIGYEPISTRLEPHYSRIKQKRQSN